MTPWGVWGLLAVCFGSTHPSITRSALVDRHLLELYNSSCVFGSRDTPCVYSYASCPPKQGLGYLSIKTCMCWASSWGCAGRTSSTPERVEPWSKAAGDMISCDREEPSLVGRHDPTHWRTCTWGVSSKCCLTTGGLPSISLPYDTPPPIIIDDGVHPLSPPFFFPG